MARQAVRRCVTPATYHILALTAIAMVRSSWADFWLEYVMLSSSTASGAVFGPKSWGHRGERRFVEAEAGTRPIVRHRTLRITDC